MNDSCKTLFLSALEKITSSSELHAKWLNTLSYLENCGARKIAASEHPKMVKKEVLKHAAEEFRHAHYLKKQIERVSSHPFADYSFENILGSYATWHYLLLLDLQTCRFLREKGHNEEEIKEAAYLLVTYAIEKRAQMLYPLYDRLLRQIQSKVTVKSILLEEEGHIREMEEGLKALPNGSYYAEVVCSFETLLCSKWLKAVYTHL